MNQFGEDPSVPAYKGRTVRQGTATVALGAGATLELGNQLVAVKSLAGDAGSVVVLGGVSDFYVGSPYDPATDTEFAGALTGTGQVLYANLGTWALSGASTFDGSVYVNAGALRAGAAGALSPNAQVFLFDTTLDLNDFDQTVRSVADERAPGALTSTAQVRLGAARLTINSILPEASISGVISGTGGLTLSGPGRLSLVGANTYTGNTVVRDEAVLNVNGTTFTDVVLDILSVPWSDTIYP